MPNEISKKLDGFIREETGISRRTGQQARQPLDARPSLKGQNLEQRTP
jgi:hypothetical protein